MNNLNDLYAPACDTDCEETTLLAVSTVCFDANSIEESEIIGLYMSEPDPANPGEPLNPITGWTDSGLAADATINEAAILSWIATMDNAATGGLRFMKGIGDKPAPTTTDVTGPEGKIVKIGKKHTLNFDNLNIDNLNYAFFQKVDACGGNVHIWYITKQYIYGGLNGVKMNITGAPHVLARGAGSIAINPVTAEWYAKTDPPRDANPA